MHATPVNMNFHFSSYCLSLAGNSLFLQLCLENSTVTKRLCIHATCACACSRVSNNQHARFLWIICMYMYREERMAVSRIALTIGDSRYTRSVSWHLNPFVSAYTELQNIYMNSLSHAVLVLLHVKYVNVFVISNYIRKSVM